MYLVPPWQQQQMTTSASHQNVPTNMPSGSAQPTAANSGGAPASCELLPAPVQAPHTTPPPSQLPVMNLAKVSRNDESQTTPRRAADAAVINHHHHRQQQADTGGLQSTSGAMPPGYAVYGHAFSSQQPFAAPAAGSSGAAPPGGWQPAAPQYQQQPWYAAQLPQHRAHDASPPGAWPPAQDSRQDLGLPCATKRLPQCFKRGGSGEGRAPATGRGLMPGQQQQHGLGMSRLPGTARHAGHPYLQYMPAAPARSHQGRGTVYQADTASTLPLLQPAARRTTAGGTSAPQPPPPRAAPPVGSRVAGSKGNVYARLSQGLPSIETSRSSRQQAAHAQAPSAGVPQQFQQQRQPALSAAAAQLPGSWQQAAEQGALGGGGPGSTGLTPRTANLSLDAQCNNAFRAAAAAGQPAHASLQPVHQQFAAAPVQGAPDAGHLYAAPSGPGQQQPCAYYAPWYSSGQPGQQHQQYAKPPLNSSGSIASQFAKLHSSGSCDAAGLYPAPAPAPGAATSKAGGTWQTVPGMFEPLAWPVKAVRAQDSPHSLPAQPRQQPAISGALRSLDGPAAPQQPLRSSIPIIAPQYSTALQAAGSGAAVQQQHHHQQQRACSYAAALGPVVQQPCTPAQQQWQQQQTNAAHTQVQQTAHAYDADLAAAVAEEVAVYDLQRQQSLLVRQATLTEPLGVLAAGSIPGTATQQAGGLARCLSYASEASAAAGGQPRVGSSGASSVEGPASALQPQPARTAPSAIRRWGHLLTPFEQSEILSFHQVWFVGMPGSAKIRGERGSASPNYGYDDSRGDYIYVSGDHIAYRYEVVGVLGRGSFGQVLRCVDHASGREVALKIIRNKKRFQKQAAIEAGILALLREQDPDDAVNIVQCYDSFTFRGHLCITFELLSINLYELIKARNFQGSGLPMIRSVAQQVLAALRFLLRLNIVHCDLKPENILLCQHGHTAVKVIDFGSSCYVDQRMFTYIQSRFYRSPEVILGLPYGHAIDMWSLGCILAELLTGQPIFPGEDEKEQLACIMELLGLPPRSLVEGAPRADLFFDKDTWAPLPGAPNSRGKTHHPASRTFEQALGGCDDPLFVDFLQRCLRWEPQRRMDPTEALQHPWVVVNSNAGAISSRDWPPEAREARGSRLGGGLISLASGLFSGAATFL